jgi:hypothetical protein
MFKRLIGRAFDFILAAWYLPVTPPRQEAVPYPGGVKARLILSADRLGEAFALTQVSVHFPGMAEDIANNRIDFGQSKGGILLHDSLRGHALPVGCDNGIESHACGANAHYTIHITNQRYRHGGHKKRHWLSSFDSTLAVPWPIRQLSTAPNSHHCSKLGREFGSRCQACTTSRMEGLL